MNNYIETVRARSCGNGYTTDDGIIILGRQGVSMTRTWSDQGVHIEANDGTGIRMEISHSVNNSRHVDAQGSGLTSAQLRYSIAKYFAHHQLQRRVAPITAGYCYGMHHDPYAYVNDDIFFAPVIYRPESNALLDIDQFAVIGFFRKDSYELKSTSSTPDFLANIAAANFASWVHDCDSSKGVDYVRRRIAWLTGATIMRETQGTDDFKTVALVKSDMSTDVPTSILTVAQRIAS